MQITPYENIAAAQRTGNIDNRLIQQPDFIAKHSNTPTRSLALRTRRRQTSGAQDRGVSTMNLDIPPFALHRISGDNATMGHILA